MNNSNKFLDYIKKNNFIQGDDANQSKKLPVKTQDFQSLHRNNQSRNHLLNSE